MKTNNDLYFGMIPNSYFYNREEGKQTILEQLNKEQVTLLILYNIQALKSANKITYTSIGKLLELCGYGDIQKNIKKFKEILKRLEELEYIEVKQDIETIKKNELLEITTEGLDNLLEDGFFIMTNEEIELIQKLDNKRGRMTNALVVYFYLKARTFKYNAENEDKIDYYAPTTYQSVAYLQDYTYVKNINNVIEDLEELDLITVKRNMQMTDKKGNIQNCSNIYLINGLLDEDKMNKNEALEQGFSRYKADRKQEGYTNFRKISVEQKQQQTFNAGLKGQLKKQKNEGRDTTEIEEKLAKAEQKKQQQKKQTNNANVIEFSDIRTDKGIPKKKKVNPFTKAVKEDIEEPITRADMFKSACNVMKQKQSKDISEAKIEDIEEYEYKRRYIPNF